MLAYERVGSGPPLVLLHGVGHRRQAWYPVVDRLRDRRELILVDLPGHGDSDPLDLNGRPVDEVLRAELVAFLAEQGLDRPHLAGNSLGGLIALEAGAMGAARSVTAFSPAGFWRSEVDFGYSRWLFHTVERIGGRLGPRMPQLLASPTGRALLFGWINAHPRRVDPEHALGDFEAFGRATAALHAVLDGARPFQGTIAPSLPVTIAWGGRDVVLPLYQARRARAALPGARHVRLPGCGHVPMTDDPELVAGVLLRGSAN